MVIVLRPYDLFPLEIAQELAQLGRCMILKHERLA